MAKQGAIKFDSGWLKYKRAISPTFLQSVFLKRRVSIASGRNGKEGEKQVRVEIKKIGPTNAELTTDLKGGNKPIVGTKGADLWNSVTSIVPEWNSTIVGTKRTVNRGGREYNIAKTVHDGKRIRVTKKMRNMFSLLAHATKQKKAGKAIPQLKGRALELWNMSSSKVFYPLKSSTKVVIIPPRKFIRNAFKDQGFIRIVKNNWASAVNLAFKDTARKK